MSLFRTDYAARANNTIAAFDALEMKGRATELKPEETLLLQEARALKGQMKSRGLNDTYYQLSWRMQALGTKESKEVDEVCRSRLTQVAHEWKKTRPEFVAKQLSDKDLDLLKQASRYPAIAKRLLKNEALRASFFKWALRDRNPVSVFMRFPALAMKLRQGLLTGRIGRYGGEPLKIETLDCRDVVTLPFFDGREVKRINILDPATPVSLNNNWRTNVGHILKIFSEKNIRCGDVELVGPRGVIMNWNVQLLGSYNPKTNSHYLVNLDDPNLWDILPPVEELSHSELEQVYQMPVERGSWVVALLASRHRCTMDIEETHGYFEMAMPLRDGRYRIFSMGKYAITYPVTGWQRITFLANTLLAKICIPDENSYFSHRQHAFVVKVITAEQSGALLHRIKSDLFRARVGNLVFQLIADSCANWAVELFNSISHEPPVNYFQVHALAAYPSNWKLAVILHAIRKLHPALHYIAFRALGRLLWDGRSVEIELDGQKRSVSVANSQFGRQQLMQHPAHMIQQILEAKLKGVVFHGHR